MKLDELKAIIKESVREVLREESTLKNLVSESITTSINTVFKVILENRDLFTTKEVIKESVQVQHPQPPENRTPKQIEDDAIRRFRQQTKNQAAINQKQMFAGLAGPNPQQVVTEQTKTRQEVPKQQIQPPKQNGKSNYLNMIQNAELDEEELYDNELDFI